MLLVLVLFGVAAIVLLGAPVVLTAGRWQVRYPRLALTLWFGALAAGCGAAAASVATAALAAIGDSGGVTATLFAWLGLVAVGATVAVIAGASEPIVHSHRSELRELTPLVVSRQQRKGFVLARFADASPIACSVRRPEPMILLSTRVEELLTPAQLRAVLAHEFAHLRGRHDLAMRIAQINAACLPSRLPAGRALRRATGLLVELIADDAAARQAGAANLANALARLSEETEDPGMLLRAERLTLRRWPVSARRDVPESIRV